MSYIMMNVFKTSLYISIPIIFIALFKSKILSKYTYKFKYITCILITIRMIFVFSIEIYLPFEILSKVENNLLNTTYISKNIVSSEVLFNSILCIWITGMAVVIFTYMYKHIMFYKKMKNIKYEVIDKSIINILENEKQDLKVKRNIRVFKVSGLSSPTLIGFVNNKIIIPNKEYKEEELKWVFRHELIHHKRKDNLLKLLLMIASAIHWFNPLVKIFNKYFKEQCELSCDEKVVEKLKVDEVKNYALVLVNSLRYKNTLKSTFCSSQFNTEEISLIKNRVEGILEPNRYKNGTNISILMIIMTVISVLSINVITSPIINANETATTIDFESMETEFVNSIMEYLTEEEKQQARIERDEDNSLIIIVGDKKSFSISKSFINIKNK